MNQVVDPGMVDSEEEFEDPSGVAFGARNEVSERDWGQCRPWSSATSAPALGPLDQEAQTSFKSMYMLVYVYTCNLQGCF